MVGKMFTKEFKKAYEDIANYVYYKELESFLSIAPHRVGLLKNHPFLQYIDFTLFFQSELAISADIAIRLYYLEYAIYCNIADKDAFSTVESVEQFEDLDKIFQVWNESI